MPRIPRGPGGVMCAETALKGFLCLEDAMKSRKEELLTAERLREILDYDPETGVFRWKIEQQGPAKKGAIAGSIHSRGYINLVIDGKKYLAHRLAFLWVFGAFPSNHVDHINGDRKDNRWDNLRPCDRRMNLQNQRKAHIDSNSGFLGVSRASLAHIKHPWRADICVAGKRKHLGCFATPEEAYKAYLEAKRKRHLGCTI